MNFVNKMFSERSVRSELDAYRIWTMEEFQFNLSVISHSYLLENIGLLLQKLAPRYMQNLIHVAIYSVYIFENTLSTFFILIFLLV